MADAFPSLVLRCLGPPLVLVGGGDPPPDVVWKKHVALLTYLALSPDRTRTRDHLIGLLWAESSDDKARRSLNEAVRRLRLSLGSDRLVTHGESLQLNAEGLEVDALQFESLCREGRVGALELLRGDFLEGLHVDDAPTFDTWMETRRALVWDAATRLLIASAEEQFAVCRYVEARALARRALGSNPYSEPAVSLAMRSAALDGDAAGALAIHHEFAERLQRDLAEPPSRASSELAARIRDGTWQRPSGGHVTGAQPIVGRREAHERLFAHLERLPRGEPVCLVIAGDPGSGRSRLLDACAERLALAGATLAVARILESDHDASWSTLRALMRGGLLAAPGLAGTDHTGLRVLAGLVPELAERVEPLEARDVAQVSHALASLLRSVAEEQPVALLVDDAQWADGVTLAALRAVWSRERGVPLALVLTVQVGADLVPELRALVGSVGREIPGVEVHLEPLTSDDIEQLVETMVPWCTGKEDRDRLARRIAQESGGSPFLAVWLLRDLDQAAQSGRNPIEWPRPGATYDSTLPVRISGVARNAISGRVAKLDADSIAVLRAASVAGDLLDPALLAEVTGLPGDRVDGALDRLERERFLLFDSRRYAFNGGVLPAVIEGDCMQSGGRRRLRERYIVALAGRDGIDERLLRARLLLAERRPEAFEAARSVAEQAATVGAARAAAAAVRIAERAAAADPGRLALLQRLRQERVGTQ